MALGDSFYGNGSIGTGADVDDIARKNSATKAGVKTTTAFKLRSMNAFARSHSNQPSSIVCMILLLDSDTAKLIILGERRSCLRSTDTMAAANYSLNALKTACPTWLPCLMPSVLS
jgi:hypothetical protein